MQENHEFHHLFDYGDIKDDHKAAAQEIASLLDNQNLGNIAEDIRIRFKIKEIPKYKFDQHPLVDAAKEVGLYVAVQGHIREIQEDGTPLEFPIIVLSDDCRKFEKLYDAIVNKVKNEKN
jgi:hypothetical protein